MQELKLTTPLPPSVNDYLGKKIGFNPITKRSYVQVYETTKAKEFKRAVQYIVKRELPKQPWTKTEKGTYVICEIVVYVAKARSDSDNIFKCLLDSLVQTDSLVFDDFYIIPRVQDIFIDCENPRVELRLIESEKRGIFSSSQHLESFKEKNCYQCNRLKRNCSLLKKALDNKILLEIDHNEQVCKVKK